MVVKSWAEPGHRVSKKQHFFINKKIVVKGIISFTTTLLRVTNCIKHLHQVNIKSSFVFVLRLHFIYLLLSENKGGTRSLKRNFVANTNCFFVFSEFKRSQFFFIFINKIYLRNLINLNDVYMTCWGFKKRLLWMLIFWKWEVITWK